MYKIITGYLNNVKKSMSSEELFHVDRILMDKFGIWASDNKFNWKLTLVSMFLIMFSFIPQCNFLRKAIANNDSRSIALCVPEIIYFCLSILTIQNFLWHENQFKQLVQKLEFEWKKSLLMENPEWKKIQSTTVKSSNKLSFLFKTLIYSCYFFYCVLPYCIFFVKFNIFGIRDKKFNLIMIE